MLRHLTALSPLVQLVQLVFYVHSGRGPEHPSVDLFVTLAEVIDVEIHGVRVVCLRTFTSEIGDIELLFHAAAEVGLGLRRCVDELLDVVEQRCVVLCSALQC